MVPLGCQNDLLKKQNPNFYRKFVLNAPLIHSHRVAERFRGLMLGPRNPTSMTNMLSCSAGGMVQPNPQLTLEDNFSSLNSLQSVWSLKISLSPGLL